MNTGVRGAADRPDDGQEIAEREPSDGSVGRQGGHCHWSRPWNRAEHALLLAGEGAAVMVNDLGGDGRGEGTT